MKSFTKNNLFVEQFDSLNEFCRIIESRDENKYLSDLRLGHATDDYEFYGSSSWDEAQGLLRNGYAEGLKNLMESKQGITFSMPTKTNTRRTDFVGQRPNIVNAINGFPKTMVRRINTERPTKTISLYYDNGASASVSHQTLLVGGKNAMALVKHLEDRGYRVQLCVFNGNIANRRDGSRHIIATVRIKEFKQKLNPLLVSYPLIHPSFFRRHMFRWRETSKWINSTWKDYGYTLRNFHYNTQDYLRTNGVIGKDDYYIDCLSASNCNTIEDMLSLIKFNSK